MVLSVSVNALAYQEIETEYLGNITLAEVREAMSSISFFTMPAERENRYITINQPYTWGKNDTWYDWTVAAGTYHIQTPDVDDSQLYVIQTQPSYGTGLHLAVPSNFYVDYVSEPRSDISDWPYIEINGTVEMFLTAYSDGNYARIFPQEMQVLINDVPLGDKFTMTSEGYTFNEYIFEVTEPIFSVGYRFIYNQANSGSVTTSGETQRKTGVKINDQGIWIETSDPSPDDPTPGLLDNLIQWVIGIYNSVFVPDSQKDDADAFQSEVSGTVTEADNVKTELDELEKPEPEEIDTDLSGIISDETYTQQTQIFVDLLKFEKITNMLMIVFTMALISYVLFGKKG